jgi:hypothetical protein
MACCNASSSKAILNPNAGQYRTIAKATPNAELPISGRQTISTALLK